MLEDHLQTRFNTYTPYYRHKLQLLDDLLGAGVNPATQTVDIRGEIYTFQRDDLLDYHLYMGKGDVVCL